MRSRTCTQLGTYKSTMVSTQKNAASYCRIISWRTSTTSTKNRRV